MTYREIQNACAGNYWELLLSRFDHIITQVNEVTLIISRPRPKTRWLKNNAGQ